MRSARTRRVELAAARRSVANDLRAGADSPYYLADFYLRETVQGTDATPDDIAALAENVTAEDVAAIARGPYFEATPSEKACLYCSFDRLCPARERGRKVVE